ncbi:TlpA disulfide reductase family protein [Phocaeicola abscessus]|uniref:TlpA disulfide reductase family protein n=1 Tax=Phocaeicola abscessus TaxID=555313 RepID=UPI0003866174|nr:TlpA disulfide reductase family protein [Phocaeicola abscessus]EPT33328.1 redoxin [Bacteroidetes bacterium oral taxon 272 str. F0290]
MKKLFALLCASAIAACQSGPRHPNRISGQLDSIPGDRLLAFVVNEDFTALDRVDTIRLDNGRFRYDFKYPTARILTLFPDGEGTREASVQGAIELLFIPGEEAVLGGTLKAPRFDGSAFFKELDKIEQQLRSAVPNLEEKYQKLLEAGASQDSIADAYTKEAEENLKKQKEIVRPYLLAHPDKNISVYLAAKYMDTELLDCFDRLPGHIKDGPLANFIRTTSTRAREEKARQEVADKIQEGNPAPDFTLKDHNGNDFTLSSIYNQGKYILLDFWGTWCIWCIKGIPSMQETYTTYKHRMEIVSIDCNDKAEDWKAFLANNRLPWIHVRNDGNPDISGRYGIQGYPTKLILDPAGKIVKISVGEDPKFYEELKDLLK